METVLDYVQDICFDMDQPRLLHAHAIEAHRRGLHHLASSVREQEQHYIDANEWPSGGSEVMEDFSHFEPVVYCSFNWFSITLTSYLRLIALVDLCNRNDWFLEHLVKNEKTVSAACKVYVESVAPAVSKWRNKVAAHPAATAPVGLNDSRGADRLGTLLQSFSCPVTRSAGYFEVGRAKWEIDGELADLLPWSVTAIYERLTPRFWPDAPIRPHRHRPGSEPRNEPGTYLRMVRTTE